MIKQEKGLFCLILSVVIITNIVTAWVCMKLIGPQPQIIPTKEITNPKVIETQLKVSENTSKEIVSEIKKAKPVYTYYEKSESSTKLAKDIAKDIKKDSPKLPQVIKEKSDRTVISPNDDLQEVNVYKINLEKAHKVKLGAIITKDEINPTIGYQAGRVDASIILKSSGIKGVAISYTIYKW